MCHPVYFTTPTFGMEMSRRESIDGSSSGSSTTGSSRFVVTAFGAIRGAKMVKAFLLSYFGVDVRRIALQYLQSSVKRQELGCVNSLPGSAWLSIPVLSSS